MSMNLHGRSFLTLMDFSATEINGLLQLAKRLKQQKRMGQSSPKRLQGKNIVLIFDKPSTRTHCAFEVAAYDEGAQVTHLAHSHIGYKESVVDTAKFLGRLYDGIEYRGFAHRDIELLAAHAGVPVWNGLTDQDHPTQALADVLTIIEHVNKPLHQVKLVYVGDARNNVANALLIASAKLGLHFVALAPPELSLTAESLSLVQAEAAQSGARLEVSHQSEQAMRGADVVYTDVWVSMGEESQLAERIELLRPFQVNQPLLMQTGNDQVIFMHCLPACHDLNTKMGEAVYARFGLKELEVTDEVFNSRHAVVFDQAENRMHTIKAVMLATLLPSLT